MSEPSEPSGQAELARRLVDLLELTDHPVALTFRTGPGTGPGAEQRRMVPRVEPQPAGCCFWEPARQHRLETVAADHAHCSVGSYTHGFIPLEQAAAGADTAALVGSGWVTEADLTAAPAIPFAPASIVYEPLSDAPSPDVVLVRVTPTSLMTLGGAMPELSLTGKPQCAIVPLALGGRSSVSPGCAVSRARTALPSDALTAAIPARELPGLLARLEASVAADRTVTEFATDDLARNFAHP